MLPPARPARARKSIIDKYAAPPQPADEDEEDAREPPLKKSRTGDNGNAEDEEREVEEGLLAESIGAGKKKDKAGGNTLGDLASEKAKRKTAVGVSPFRLSMSRIELFRRVP
jgi:hypothetical protein